MEHNMRQPNAAVDYLSLRLRRIVRSVIERERMTQPSTWLALLGSNQYPLVNKILRIVTFTICVALFSMQVYDRTDYYFTSPISTDVQVIQNNDEPYPDMTICHDPIEETQQLFADLGISAPDGIQVAAMVVVAKKRRLTLEVIWKRLKTSNDIVSAKVTGNSTTENLAYIDSSMLYGTCATFRRNSTIPLRNNQGKLEIVFRYERNNMTKNTIDYLYVHEPNEQPASRYEHEAMPGFKNVIKITVKRYNFQYRKSNPCISSDDYEKCVHECFTNFSMRNGRCRLPFQPIEAKIPGCGYIPAGKLWKKMQSYLRGNINDKCTCTRKCSHRTFDTRIESVASYINQTVFVLEFGNSHTTVINERFIYTAVNLLADIGGNSGLWIGLSALSVFHFLSSRSKPKKKQHSFSPTDPLYRIVLKRIRRDGRSWYPHSIQGTSHSFINIRSLFVGSIGLLFAYAVCNRINKFFQYPVHTVVDITFMQTILPPSVTICPGNTHLESLQKNYATINNVSDFCEVKIWQLLGIPGINAHILWAHNKNLTKKIQWTRSKPEYLHDGVCFNALHTIKHINAKSKKFAASVHAPLCGQNYMKIYIKPTTGYYDYYLYRYIMLYNKHSISFVLKRIAANKDDDDCVSEIDHESCKSACLTRKLWQKINCWLPFMPPSNLSLCDSPNSAKHSLQVYSELFVLRESLDDCKCLPPCFKHIYDVTIEAELWYANRASFGFGTKHNIMETYRKVRVYTLVALLCDIGSWLGSTLGLCVFSVIDILLNAVKFKKRRLPKVRHQK